MDSDFKTALAPGDYDADLLRPALVRRTIYTFALSEDPSTFVALVNGAIPNSIAWNNTIFWLDETDTTTAHDGVTVIRTSDDYCYKVEDIDMRTRSVLSFTTTAPPGSPSVGDAYLVPAGATGAWSGHQDDIATYTPRGWVFEVPTIGRWLLDEEVGGYLGYYSTGWEYGPGARSFDDQSVPLSAALGWGERVIVENQTTTTPPTATKGLRYVVGASATGAWLGKDKQIAICEVAGTWTFYPASNGWAIYDKALNNTYVYNGTAWVSSGGAYIGFKCSALTVSGSDTTRSPAGAAYTYSASTAPTTAQWRRTDDVGVSYAAKRASSEPTPTLEISWTVDLSFTAVGTPSFPIAWALFRDSVVDAIAWGVCGQPDVSDTITYKHVEVTTLVPAADASAHTYFFAVMNQGPNGGNNISVTAMTRRRTIVRELA